MLIQVLSLPSASFFGTAGGDLIVGVILKDHMAFFVGQAFSR